MLKNILLPESIFKKKLFSPLLFLFYSAFVFYLYHETIGCRIVTDALGWIQQYEQQGISGLATCFGDVSLHYVYHVLNFSLYQLFGTNETGWYVVFSLLQAVNAWLIFYVFSKYIQYFSTEHADKISLAASIIFLVSPYQTEAVVWAATIHYLIITTFFLCGFFCMLKFLLSGKISYLIICHLLFILSFFSHGLSIIFPFILFVLLIPIFRQNKGYLKRIFFLFFIPQLLLVAAYLLMNFVLLGNITGHVSQYTSDDFSFKTIILNFNNYVLKNLFLVQTFSAGIRNAVYSVVQNNILIYVSACCYAMALLFFLMRFKTLKASLQFAGIILICCALALSPVLKLYFYTIQFIESDRLNYFASIFFCLFLAFIIHHAKLFVKIVFYSLFLFLSFHALHRNINAWQGSAQIQTHLEHTFPDCESKRIFILNDIDNFNGAPVYRDDKFETKFDDALELKLHKQCNNIISVLQYNMTSRTDSVMVEIISPTTLKITFAQWGNWWWQNGIGASDYETSDLSVKIDTLSHSYILEIKNKKADDVYLYQCGSNWRRVNF